MNEICQKIKEVPLSELGEVFALLAKKIDNYRKKNNGFLPLEVFKYCISIGGGYLCAEIVITSTDGNGYYLKKRNAPEEEDWKGQYQIPGTFIRATDTPEDFFDRLSEEVFGKNGTRIAMRDIEFIGTETHDEPERSATCWTVIWLLPIEDSQVDLLSGDWQFFKQKDMEDLRIVDHHRNTLKWVSQTLRDIFVDLR